MILESNNENLNLAAGFLQQGKLVAFPTETVYGLGANALNDSAVREIYKVKGRPADNPLIVHIASLNDLDQLSPALGIPAIRARVLKLSDFWPGPLSLVLPKHSHISSVVSGGKDSIAVRIPNHPVALALIELAKLPIAAPSANIYAYVSPTSALHVEESLASSVACILDGGKCEVGLESTVLSLAHEQPTLLRPGAVSHKDIEEKLGEKVMILKNSDLQEQQSPGMAKIHYAPHTQTITIDQFKSDFYWGQRVGLISFRAYEDALEFDFAAIEVLSSCADLNEVARNLFDSLRKMDKLDLGLIVVDTCNLHGMGAAIMDRVKRATTAKLVKKNNAIGR